MNWTSLSATFLREGVSVSLILSKLSVGAVSQRQADVFLYKKYGNTQLSVTKIPPEQFMQLVKEAKAYKENNFQELQMRLLLQDLQPSKAQTIEKLKEGMLRDTLRKSIVKHQLMLDRVSNADQRNVVYRTLSTLRDELKAIEQPQPSRPKQLQLFKSFQQVVKQLFKKYSARSYQLNELMSFEEREQHGIDLHQTVCLLKERGLQIVDSAELIKIFKRAGRGLARLDCQQLLTFLEELHEFYLQNYEAIDLKSKFIEELPKRKLSTSRLAPHSGRLSNQLKQALVSSPVRLPLPLTRSRPVSLTKSKTQKCKPIKAVAVREQKKEEECRYRSGRSHRSWLQIKRKRLQQEEQRRRKEALKELLVKEEDQLLQKILI